MLAGHPLFRNLLMSGKKSQDVRKQLDWAKGALEVAGLDMSALQIPVYAEGIMAKAVKDLSIKVRLLTRHCVAGCWAARLLVAACGNDPDLVAPLNTV